MRRITGNTQEIELLYNMTRSKLPMAEQFVQKAASHMLAPLN
jgi:hypothetical protein